MVNVTLTAETAPHALEAARALSIALRAMNAADVTSLSVQAPGTTYQNVVDALRACLVEYLADEYLAADVMSFLVETGEDVDRGIEVARERAADDCLVVVADKASEAMESDRERAWTPSAVARKAGISTDDARNGLAYLVEHQYAHTAGNGAWTKYILGRTA